MKLTELFDVDKLHTHIANGYINVNNYENYELYNYAPKTQIDRNWDEVTSACRGLIVNKDTLEIVARPFEKFFNLSEHSSSDVRLSKDFTIHEKMDGSLGILWYDTEGNSYISTRGSFTSDQALWATEFWHKNYAKKYDYLFRNSGHTFLFEIVYPENRIVIKYDYTDLVLLDVVNVETGRASYRYKLLWTGRHTQEYQFGFQTKPKEILDKATSLGYDTGNFEGFVLKFNLKDRDFRVKVKLEEYVRLHKLFTNISSTSIWEALCKGESIEEAIGELPDEAYDWAKNWVDRLTKEFIVIELASRIEYMHITEDEENLEKIRNLETPGRLKPLTGIDRKGFAAKAVQYKHKDVLFALLDEKDYSNMIWKKIKPAWEPPYGAS